MLVTRKGEGGLAYVVWFFVAVLAAEVGVVCVAGTVAVLDPGQGWR